MKTKTKNTELETKSETKTTELETQVRDQKTKEIVMGPPLLVTNLPPIQGPVCWIEQVSSLKFLGVHLDANFSWKSHVEAILSKATQRLYFLKLLNRAGVPHAQSYYISMWR